MHALLQRCNDVAAQSTNGIGTKRKENKWEVTLCAIVNLPATMRFVHDFMLLAGLYSSMWAKGKGGILRMLNAVTATGTDCMDSSTFRAVTMTSSSTAPPCARTGGASATVRPAKASPAEIRDVVKRVEHAFILLLLPCR